MNTLYKIHTEHNKNSIHNEKRSPNSIPDWAHLIHSQMLNSAVLAAFHHRRQPCIQ